MIVMVMMVISLVLFCIPSMGKNLAAAKRYESVS